MHIVYNIVHQTLKGKLKIHSVLNEVIAFTFSFPRVLIN
jgi:hypothetical protein